MKKGEDDPDFAQSATRLAGLSGALLGWRPGEFWAATPAELAAVVSALAQDKSAPGTPASTSDLARLKERFPDG